MLTFTKLSDQSYQYIESLLPLLQPEEVMVDRMRWILSNASDLYMLYVGEQLVGFIKSKYQPEKQVIYVPFYIIPHTDISVPDEVLKQRELLFPASEINYCVFFHFFHSVGEVQIQQAFTPCDYSISMELQLPKPIATEEIAAGIAIHTEELSLDDLLELHQLTYANEPVYVVGEWKDLLGHYLELPNHLTYTCRSQGQLIGACLGTYSENGHYIYSLCLLDSYQGKHIGAMLLRTYIEQTKAKCYQLSVYNSNTHAKRLYESLGFQKRYISSVIYHL